MKNSDYMKAIEAEVEHWPGVTVEFVEGGKHPKAKFTFDGKLLSRAFAGTPSDAAFGIHNMLGDMRRIMKQLGATRATPNPTREQDEAPYRKPNDGADKRPHPVKGEPASPKEDIPDQLVKAGVESVEQASAARAERDASVAAHDPGADSRNGSKTETEDAIAKAFKERVAGIVDGIYFDLPDDVYHAVPRLSSSGIQRLCVSPATFWRGSWMDPDREDESDEQEKLFRRLGRAYHMARLQPELFDETFVRSLSKDDYPKGRLLVTGSDMKAELEDMGLKVSGTVAEQAERLADNGCQKFIWKIEEEKWEKARRGRTEIPAKHFDQMKTDIDRIHGNGPLTKLLSGGQAEVSIFWTDQYGIKMKSRVDYLTALWWVDFKTFDNSRGKTLQQCLADAVRYNRYYVQAVVYREAVRAIRQLTIIGDATDAQKELVAAIQISPDEMACWYAFQEKNGIPNLLAREFPFYSIPYSTLFNEPLARNEEYRQAVRDATEHPSRLSALGEREVFIAKRNFALYNQVYPEGEPWYPLEPIGAFTDEDFSSYWLEGGLQ